MLCYFTTLRTQFFCFLQSHLLGLQDPVTTLTELPWSESQIQHSTIVTLPQDRCVRLRVTSIAFVRSVCTEVASLPE
jgi:hypothetical protein